MAPAYTWLFTLNAVLHAIASAVMLAIVWVGWRRHRHLGFLLLTGWAIIAIFNTFGPSLLMPLAHRFFQGTATQTRNLLALLPSLIMGWVSTLFLFAGLALLVFQSPMNQATDTRRDSPPAA